jgi:hypothetical protein
VDAVIAAHIREVTDEEFARLVTDLHAGRPTFGLARGTGAPADAVQETSAA